MIGAPCKNCAHREIGCHAKCGKYEIFRLANAERLRKEHRENEYQRIHNRRQYR